MLIIHAWRKTFGLVNVNGGYEIVWLVLVSSMIHDQASKQCGDRQKIALLTPHACGSSAVQHLIFFFFGCLPLLFYLSFRQLLWKAPPIKRRPEGMRFFFFFHREKMGFILSRSIMSSAKANAPTYQACVV